jgi:hypothetical protein
MLVSAATIFRRHLTLSKLLPLLRSDRDRMVRKLCPNSCTYGLRVTDRSGINVRLSQLDISSDRSLRFLREI